MKGDRLPKAIRTRWFAAATVMAGLVVVVSGAAILGPWTSEPFTAEPSGTPRASAGPSPAPSASSQPLPSLPPLGERPALVATAAQGSVVPLSAGFRLSATVDETAEQLAERLTIDPPVELTRTADPATGAVLLQPAAPLQPGVVYRFDLEDGAGDPAESWAFQAEMPLHVVGTLPGDRNTDVLTSTGIEITFDQDGVQDADAHFRIMPATAGRFERHARALVFVPDKHLKAATVYTVTMTRGVSVGDTGQILEADHVFQFETRSRSTSERTVAWLTRELFDSATGERPVLGVQVFDRRKIHVEVYRFPDQDAAIVAYRRLTDRPWWTQWGGTDVLETTGLPRVVSADLTKIEQTNGAHVVRLPARLPQGAYLVQTGRSDRSQAILQVTDVAGYVAESAPKTLVWVNDLKRRAAIAGAEIRLVGGADLGVTDGSGLLAANAPDALSGGEPHDPAPILTIRTPDRRTAFLPLATSGYEARSQSYGYAPVGDLSSGEDVTADYWHLLETDRVRYRRTDTINLWAVLRDRADGSVPDGVVVQLVPGGQYDDGPSSVAAVPISSLSLKANGNGVMSGSVPLVDVADGYYDLVLRVGGAVVVQRLLEVGAIEKPSYQVSVTTGHRAYLAGDRIRTTLTARFYDGTPVPDLPLAVNGPNRERRVRTDAAGVATFATTAVADPYDLTQAISAGTARAEEASAGSEREIYVFPSSRWLQAQGTVQGGRVRVTGTVRQVDFERIERELATAPIWDLDPAGAPVAGADVRLRFIEQIPKRRQTGTAYDFIEKRVVPIYEYDTTSRPVATITVRTNAAGLFTGSIPAPSNTHDYAVELVTRDDHGRVAHIETGASADGAEADAQYEPDLREARPAADRAYSVGDAIDLTMYGVDGRVGQGRADRYLFFQVHQGIGTAVVQASPHFTSRFDAASIPNLSVHGVRFTGTGYLIASTSLPFRSVDRALTIALTPDAATYRPGGHVELAVRTLDRKGKPVPATVVLRAVDEKLYTIDAAQASDPLSALYEWVDDGLIAETATHRTPLNTEGGDSGGGGDDGLDRSDFRDVVLFRTVDTGADGRGSVSFDLSDDLTSWRIAASGFTGDLLAGEGTTSIPVGLPMFIDASISPDYLVADRPKIHLRAYGTALQPGDPVTFTVTSDSLPMPAITLKANAFEDVAAELPRLSVGPQRVTIRATASADGQAVKDQITRTFHVSTSRLTTVTSRYAELGDGPMPRGGDDLTTLVFSDTGRGRSLAMLMALLDQRGPRLDRLIAADLARETLVAVDPAGAKDLAPVEPLLPERYQESSGLALLPYSSNDLQLSSLVALLAPDSVDRPALAGYLRAVRSDRKSTRERQLIALAGLAGVRDPVLPAIQQAATDPKLTIRERLFVALGAAAMGDAATARAVEAALIDAYAEDLGDQRRLRVGDDRDDDTEATALLALLAVWVGDTRATAYWDYVEANPSARDPLVLEEAAFARALLERVPTAGASFAYTVDGTRTVVELAPGEAFALVVAAAQRADLHLEGLSGKVGVTSTWRQPASASDFETDPDVRLRRTVAPSPASSSDLVRVDLHVTFGPKALKGCYTVVDFVPSGLRPVSGTVADSRFDDEQSPTYVQPYDQTPERVSFCAVRPKNGSSVLLRYYARVVTTGSYDWEPAIARHSTRSSRAAVTEPDRLTID